MFYKDHTPPPEFVYTNLTQYQQTTIKEKWYVFSYVQKSTYSKQQCFRELSQELGKSRVAIQLIYYNIKQP